MDRARWFGAGRIEITAGLGNHIRQSLVASIGEIALKRSGPDRINRQNRKQHRMTTERLPLENSASGNPRRSKGTPTGLLPLLLGTKRLRTVAHRFRAGAISALQNLTEDGP
jgi:hypothetical protein